MTTRFVCARDRVTIRVQGTQDRSGFKFSFKQNKNIIIEDKDEDEAK